CKKVKCDPDSSSCPSYEQSSTNYGYEKDATPANYTLSHYVPENNTTFGDMKCNDYLGAPVHDPMLPSVVDSSCQNFGFGYPFASTAFDLHSPFHLDTRLEFVEPGNQLYRHYVNEAHSAIMPYKNLTYNAADPNLLPTSSSSYYKPTDQSSCKRLTENEDRNSLSLAVIPQKGSLSKVKTPGDQPKVRMISNNQLNPNAVAIMDEWYRDHLDKPYPSKYEKRRMAIAGAITEAQVGSWFANRRNRSNNTRPKQNMRRLKSALALLCYEYQALCKGLVSAAEMQARILHLIEEHTSF
ncbi:unnamed protein product, partial [Mesocestoides corti]|uniref:Homeobox domain-containing protein n=1 Tax=Mesocestoides corti TaxID=53468 RepID=A0A0R3UQE6_MESCO